MKTRLVGTWMVACTAALGLIVGLWAQEGPQQQSSETVAKPRKKGDSKPADTDPGNLPKIPSKLGPKVKDEAGTDATFKAETNIVNVDVAVLDNRGVPIPKIPRGNFRILEDNVPQTVTQFTVGEAPMTVALVIEFSNRFQSYWGQGWYE